MGGLITGRVYSIFAEARNPAGFTYEKLKIRAAYSSKPTAWFRPAKAVRSWGEAESA